MKAAPTKNKKALTADILPLSEAFPIVAIGASSGGLEAITQLLLHLPPTTGMAYIYIQHLSPDHKSILTSLLAKATKMKVQEVTDHVKMLPNQVFIIPPDKEMTVLDGHIKLTPRRKDRIFTLPIDAFFCTLADKHPHGAIGIVLSGNASDGTLGLIAIKKAGGLTFAQDSSAKFESMPQSAIASGAVDLILSPVEMAQELTRLSQHGYELREHIKAGSEEEIENNNPHLLTILTLLNKEEGVDFSFYKMNTVKRRILRRMLLYKINSIELYAKLMQEKNEEINILYQDLLINVTDFFRDTEAHNFLRTELLPAILKGKATGEALRIWIPACSTGQEAYSIAMIVSEVQKEINSHIHVQIFATDLSVKAIAKARMGEYTSHQLSAVSPLRLQNFYIKNGANYRINKTIRDMCVFAPHNLLQDPPFSHIDFISCCNLLIYFDTVAQKKAFTTFLYALNNNGFLMLGKSETIGASSKQFVAFNSRYKVYQPKKGGVPAITELSPHIKRKTTLASSVTPGKISRVSPIKIPALSNNTVAISIDAVLLNRCMPASVVINYELEILEFRGKTQPYLNHTQGKACLNIIKMAQPEIAYQLRIAIQKAIETQQEVRRDSITFLMDATTAEMVDIRIIPVTVPNDVVLLLVLFIPQKQVEKITMIDTKYKKIPISARLESKDRKIQKLTEELAAAHAEMIAFTMEQESFNEGLQVVNEEVVSNNEELQSVNEELETSKEETESINEELITTNQELQTRNELLNESYDYSEALINTIHEPMLVLDKEFRIKSANNPFFKTFQLNKAETEGMLLFDPSNKYWDIPHLHNLLDKIITRKTEMQNFELKHTFKGIGEKIMLLNASRIVQKRHENMLILLAFHDITEIRTKTKALVAAEDKKQNIEKAILVKAVTERTKELHLSNKNLEEKYNQLEKMNKDLQSFAYISSHDLQEPLRKIQTFSKMIIEREDANLSTLGKDYFRRIQNSAERMQQLILDLLAFSGINNNQNKFEETDLKKLVEAVAHELREAIEEKKATLNIAALNKLQIIPFQFRQLFQNLISNALKFSAPERPCCINISSVLKSSNDINKAGLPPNVNFCKISVADNGIGFEPQYKNRIFEVFQKLHSREIYPGTGIGLAIVKKIIDNHNGFINATGQLNKGVVFDIYIPVEQVVQ